LIEARFAREALFLPALRLKALLAEHHPALGIAALTDLSPTQNAVLLRSGLLRP
jgi:hypothetical protein